MQQSVPSSQALREVREYLNLTQKELAIALQRSKVTISSIEQGKFGVSRILAARLADHLCQTGRLPPEDLEPFQRALVLGLSVVRYLEATIGDHHPALLLRHDSLDLLESRLPVRLIGRAEEIETIQGRLDQGERVLVEGFPGIGKTALAAVIAMQRIQAGKAPVLWFEIGRETGIGLLRAIVAPVDRKDRAALQSEADLGTFVREELRKRRIALVVLEDVWKDERALTQLLKAIPQEIPVLITSRYRYKLGSQAPVTLQELSDAAALELLSLHADTDYTSNRRDDGLELCRQLGKHPLALRLAGGLLATGDYTAALLLDSLETKLHALPRVYFDDQRTISLLMEESLKPLPPQHRQVFLALGALFARQCPPELISDYLRLQGKDDEVKLALLDLEHRNLVDLEKNERKIERCTLHALAYSYARTTSFNEGNHPALAIQACLDYARRSHNDLEALHGARDNLLGAAGEALKEEAYDEALLELMWLLVDAHYFDVKGYSRLALDPLARAAQLAEGQKRWRQAHYLWTKLGNAELLYFHDYPRAEAAYRNAVAHARQLDSTEEAVQREATLLTLIAVARFHQGDEVEAQTLFQQAESLAEDERGVLSQIYEHRGHLAAQIHQDYQSARTWFTRSLTLAEQIPQDAQRQARRFFALINLGGVEHDLYNYSAALRFNEEAHQLAVEAQNDVWLAFALNEMGEQQLALNQRDAALPNLWRALSIFQEIGDRTREQKLRLFLEQQGFAPPPDGRQDQTSHAPRSHSTRA